MSQNYTPRFLCAAFFRVDGCPRGSKCATGALRASRLYRVYASTPSYLDKIAHSGKNVAFYAECDTIGSAHTAPAPKKS